MAGLRPRVELLTAGEAQAIVDDALRVLETVGFEVENGDALALLREAGVRTTASRAFADEHQVRRALGSTPARIEVFDRDGRPALDLGGERVHFDPGSAAIFFLDSETGRRRSPITADLCRLGWVADSCRHLAAQSTALVPSDVPEAMGDRFRLYVALLSSRKPVVTGTFRTDAFAVMKNMLAA
ncbi:MAG: mttB, partial [Acidobacteria bacterium]|nr:mttB [Acidobacteriota bacterium]